ncbi:MAG TPA: hypothetical protein VJ183_13490 [Chloroflexia bacterium]|nr:hypothetical protein [Chloroflexia bacterium]
MICVILPLGKEAKDTANWVVRVIMYTAGSIVGATALAFVLGFVGQGLHALLPGIGVEWAVAVLGVASLLYALHEINFIKLPNPQLGWLVPKVWQKHSYLLGHTLYGIVLGMGIWTFIPFTGFYILMAWEIVAGAVSLKAAVLLGVLYGAFRGLPAILGGISMLRGVYPMPVSNWLLARLGWWHAANGLVLLFTASFLLGSLFL